MFSHQEKDGNLAYSLSMQLLVRNMYDKRTGLV